MRKAYYAIGPINRYVSLDFSITLINRMGKYCIDTSRGNLSVGNMYPTIMVSLRDEIPDKDSRPGWSPEKTFHISKFTTKRLVVQGRKFLQQFVEYKDLFVYREGKLLVNKEIADKIKFISVVDFDRKIMVMPVVAKDPETTAIYEGVAIMNGGFSNYAVLSYDEFTSFIEFLDTFDFDGVALKLLALTRGVNIEEIPSTNPMPEEVLPEKAPDDKSEGDAWVDKTGAIPEL